jgi:hypothetical protein
MREHGVEDWGTLWRAWNETCREDWRYLSKRNIQQTYERFTEGVVCRAYAWPNYRLPEKTPFQAYRNDWLERRKGTG